MTNTYNLLCCADKNYCDYCFTLWQSILDHLETKESNTNDKLIFHCMMDNTVSISNFEEKAQKFSKFNINSSVSFEIIPYQVSNKLFLQCNPIMHYDATFSTYYRLLVGEVLPESIKYVLYLDIDLIVLKDIRNLFDNYPLNNKILGATQDYGLCQSKAIPFQDKDKNIIFESKISQQKNIAIPRASYFNAGVLLINLNEWRKNNILQKCLTINLNLKTQWHDQDLLNISCLNNVDFIDPNWNANLFYFEIMYYILNMNNQDFNYVSSDLHLPYKHNSLAEFVNSIKIVHFIGSKTCKPWFSREELISKNYPSDLLPYFVKVIESHNLWHKINQKVSKALQ